MLDLSQIWKQDDIKHSTIQEGPGSRYSQEPGGSFLYPETSRAFLCYWGLTVYQGYIKTWRKVLASDMYKALTASQRDVFWSCLLLANHDEKEWEWQGRLFRCAPGQFVTSLANLKYLCAPDTSTQNIRTALVKLEKWQFLTNKSTKTGRLITVINWAYYQGNENKLTKQSTKNQQSTNKELTTNKNDKNVKKEKKRTYTSDFESFWKEYPNKTAKKPSWEKWVKLNNDRPPIEILLKAIEKQKQSDKWKKGFIPNPLTWLNQARWEDEIQENAGNDNIYDRLIAANEAADKVVQQKGSDAGSA